MASKNPFGQLSIRRDDDEKAEVEAVIQTKVNASNSVVMQQQSQDKKKKKVRPDEKKKEDQSEQVEDFGGFSVVGKKKTTGKPREQNTSAVPEDKERRNVKNKGAHAERNKKVTEGKRAFDRQSGTGRGKEISKGGAGGKHTWGANPKNIAKSGEEEYNYDESVFDKVLNAKPKPVRQEQEEAETKEIEEVKPVEATEEEKKEETPAEGEKEVNFDKRKKKGIVTEEKKEDLLERPENPLSVAEYLEKLKEKNSAIPKGKAKAAVAAENSDLKPKTKDEDLSIGIAVEGGQKTGKVKPKEKKQEAKDLNIGFKFGDEPTKSYDNYRENNYGKKKGPKFQFKADDFPEL